MNTNTPELRSLARLAADLQRPVHLIERAIVATGASPALSLNGTRYYAPETIERIAAALRSREARVIEHR